MKNSLKVVPIPICELILGLAPLGNLFKDYRYVALGNLTGGISMILMVFISIKLFILSEHTKQALYDPIIASVSPTSTIPLMVVCAYFVSYESITLIVKFIWLCTVIFQVILIFYLNYHHVTKTDLSIGAIYPSWFTICIRFGIVTVTAGDLFSLIGKVFFWISLVCYAFSLPVIIKRVFFVRNMTHPTRPLITIAVAPGSLCPVGCLKNFAEPNFYLAIALLILSQVLYFVVLSILLHLFKLCFYPSYTAFTFPLVISAAAPFTTVHCFNNLGIYSSILDFLEVAERLSASVVVFYILTHYVHLLTKEHSKHGEFVSGKIAS